MAILYRHAKSKLSKKMVPWQNEDIKPQVTTMYNALFEWHMRYDCQIWEQIRNQHISDVNLQKKVVRIINFSDLYSVNLEYYLLMKLSINKTVF